MFSVNCCFVREDDGLTLADTAIPSSARAIIEAARALGPPNRADRRRRVSDSPAVAASGTVRLPFPFPAMATWDRSSALISARLLRSLAPTRLAVGHGEVLEQPASAIDRAIAEAARAVGERQAHGA